MKLTDKELKKFFDGVEEKKKAKKSMRDGQPTPLACSCGGFLVITRNCEGFQETCFCKSCGLFYNIKVIIIKLVAHHSYTVDLYGKLSKPVSEEVSK